VWVDGAGDWNHARISGRNPRKDIYSYSIYNSNRIRMDILSIVESAKKHEKMARDYAMKPLNDFHKNYELIGKASMPEIGLDRGVGS
jgi:hypothetical protein